MSPMNQNTFLKINNKMRIIKEGSLDNISENQWYRVTCGSCKTEFEYQLKDIKSDRDGSYVECPLKGCGKFISDSVGVPINKNI